MISNKVLVTVLTWNRINHLRKTLETLEKFNGRMDILIWDNGSTDGTKEYIKKKNYECIFSSKNIGIFLATREMWLIACNRGYDMVLNLQDDFPAERKVPIDDITEYFNIRPTAGFARLSDKTKMIKIGRDGKEKVRKKTPRRFNLITGKRIKYGEWEKVGHTYFRLHNYMLGFHPAIFRTSLVPLLVGEIIKPRERQIMEQFEKSGLKAVQIKKSCFLTTYPVRHKNWLH